MKAFPLLLLTGLLCTCDPAPDSPTEVPAVIDLDPNPPADGFDLAGSDPEAIAIADSVVKYHGGRRAYDGARYFSWNFFGARDLVWDKEEERVRIEVPQDEMVYLLDYSDRERPTGAVQKQGEELTDPDSLELYLQNARSMWINDSYWLVQPFKLKDSGVTLRYVGSEDDPQQDRPSEVIDLTFRDVGDTPGNRYRLFVDRENYRINTWQFFRNADDPEPAMETPWRGYREYDGVLLSSDRGGRFQLNDIAVSDEMDDAVFTEF
jgi:hypothetical protein